MNGKQIWMGNLAQSPLGAIWVAVSDAGLVAVSLWGDGDGFAATVVKQTGSAPVAAPERVTAVTAQLQQYFDKARRHFDLDIDWSIMTSFQATVLQAVCRIEYGRYLTYKDVAERIGQPGAVRAVGRANATNPMPIIVPCHRVLGSDGKLHGYSAPGGVETKAWLLRHEGSWLI